MKDEYICRDIHYGERKKKKKKDQAWRVKDDRLEKGDAENRAVERTRRTETTDSLARGEKERRAGVDREGGRETASQRWRELSLFSPLRPSRR